MHFRYEKNIPLDGNCFYNVTKKDNLNLEQLNDVCTVMDYLVEV